MRNQFAGSLIALLEKGNIPELPLSARIQDAVRRQLANGSLKAFERLPSTRLLAKDLSVARETVETAYQNLEAEGYLIRERGSGTYVSEAGAQLARFSAGPDKKLRTLHLSERGRRIQRLGGVRDPVPQAFAAAYPDVRAFPLDSWQQISSRIWRRHGSDLLSYCDPQGLRRLREEISRYLGSYRGVGCTADNVIVLTSSQEALMLIATMMLDANDQVAIEEPCYPGIRSALSVSGATPVPVEVDENGMVVDALVRKSPAPRGVYVTPSHQYPTTATLSLERRLALIEWAQRHRRWIIEDDYDSEYRYDGSPLSCIQGLDSSGIVLYVGTFTKTLFPAIRLAYLVAPAHLVPALVAMRTLVDGHSAIFNQAVLAEFMASGEFTTHVRRMRQFYKGRRDAFAEAIERHLSPFGTLRVPTGGFQATWYLHEEYDEIAVAEKAKAAKIILPSLSDLYLRRSRRAGFVMGFAAITPQEADTAARRLASTLKSTRSR
jgi:GntR family transcriptional regulator / MocR family aminotransferase